MTTYESSALERCPLFVHGLTVFPSSIRRLSLRLELSYQRIATFMIFATVNALVRGSRKNAANCDTHCDVRNSENRQDFERILYIREILMYIWIGVCCSV